MKSPKLGACLLLAVGCSDPGEAGSANTDDPPGEQTGGATGGGPIGGHPTIDPVVPEAEPRPFGTPLPPTLLGEQLPDNVQGAPKFTDTFFDDEGQIGMWVPPGVETIRGVYINLLVNPLWGPSGGSTLADRQLSSSWQFAYVAGWNVWQSDRDDAESMWAAIQALLDSTAQETDHPELSTAPVIIVGGSRTGRFGPSVANLHPGRVLGYVTVNANPAKDQDRTEELYGVPGLLIPGEHDGGDATVSATEELRSEGAQVSVAMNWDKGHVCGPCELVYYPFIDGVVARRLADDGKVVRLADDDAWVGDHDSWTAYPFGDSPVDTTTNSWLLDGHFANVWQAFTLRERVAEITGPKLVTEDQEVSDLSAASPLEITGSVDDASIDAVEIFDGASSIGEVTVDAEGKFTTSLEINPGLHSLVLMSGARVLSRPFVFMVIE